MRMIGAPCHGQQGGGIDSASKGIIEIHPSFPQVLDVPSLQGTVANEPDLQARHLEQRGPKAPGGTPSWEA